MTYTYTHACSSRGADMGRPELLGDGVSPVKLHLERVKFYDYAYDKGGAYWGGGTPLYVAYGTDATEDVQIFIRASTREAAKTLVRSRRKNVTFYR